jgi:hypothetical protein
MDQLSDVVIEKSVGFNNKFLQNDYLRITLLLVTGVFMGYTLQPVPKWLNKLFDTSHTLKFFVLFIAGCIAVYPVNKSNIIWVGLGSALTLGLFHAARKYDKYLDEKEEQKKNEKTN